MTPCIYLTQNDKNTLFIRYFTTVDYFLFDKFIINISDGWMNGE